MTSTKKLAWTAAILAVLLAGSAGILFLMKPQSVAETEKTVQVRKETEPDSSNTENVQPEKEEEKIEMIPIEPETMSESFVLVRDWIPSVIEDIRYAGNDNFIGRPMAFYDEPVAILTTQAVRALQSVAAQAEEMGYRLKIFDAYRPAGAVEDIIAWGADDDVSQKEKYYPNLEKSALFNGYLSTVSDHSKGSTVDLTLVDIKTGQELDMGTGFDFLDPASNLYNLEGITEEQFENRMLLRDLMNSAGFIGLQTEWWHYTLAEQPWPYQVFTFPVSREGLKEANGIQ